MFDPSTARVLVLDDDQVMRDLLHALLAMAGCDVALATSGQEALGCLADEAEFDVILTDLQMPHLEGRALAAALRQAAPEKTLLIGMSGSAPSEGVCELLDGFLPKPFDPQDLYAMIDTAQAQREAALAAVPEPPTSTDAPEQPAQVSPLDETIFQALARMIPLPQLGQLYDMTIGDIGKRLARMQISAAADSLAEVQREAHAIKGSCGMVGATELQALAAAVEGGTTLNTFAMQEIPAACLRLRRMLDGKLQTV